jgi:hypothetical protein
LFLLIMTLYAPFFATASFSANAQSLAASWHLGHQNVDISAWKYVSERSGFNTRVLGRCSKGQ